MNASPVEPSFVEPAPDDANACLVRAKAVPGASRDELAGVMDFPDGPRLKLRTSAAAESGKANKALCALLAKALGVPKKRVTLEAGQTQALKAFRVEGVDAQTALDKLRQPPAQ